MQNLEGPLEGPFGARGSFFFYRFEENLPVAWRSDLMALQVTQQAGEPQVRAQPGEFISETSSRNVKKGWNVALGLIPGLKREKVQRHRLALC